ncbi:hypothetical protein P7K49_014166, partial [Saguinus oedipus]
MCLPLESRGARRLARVRAAPGLRPPVSFLREAGFPEGDFSGHSGWTHRADPPRGSSGGSSSELIGPRAWGLRGKPFRRPKRSTSPRPRVEGWFDLPFDNRAAASPEKWAPGTGGTEAVRTAPGLPGRCGEDGQALAAEPPCLSPAPCGTEPAGVSPSRAPATLLVGGRRLDDPAPRVPIAWRLPAAQLRPATRE